MPRSDGSAPASLDIVLVNWNAGDQLRRCIASIPNRPDDYRVGRIVVVDNGSTDGSLESLNGLHGPIVIIRNQDNRGFAAACNQGASNSDADYLLFLNPDTVLEPSSIAAPMTMMELEECAQVGVCGIRLVDESGGASRTCTRLPAPSHFIAKMLGLDRLLPTRFPSHVMEEWDHMSSRDVDHVMGAFYLIRRSLFDRLRGFDEQFFVYLEDLDLSLRVRDAGYRVHYLAEACAFHKGGGTSEQVKARRLFYSLHSRILYGFKHYRRTTAVLLMAGTLVVEPIARLALAAARRSPAAISETLGGFAALWCTWPPWKAMSR